MGFFEKSNDEVMGRVLSDFSDIKGVKEVVDGYLELIDSEIYKKTVFIGFIDASDNESYELEKCPLLKMAFNNMTSFPLRLPFIPLFNIKDFYVTYTFIWNIWRCQMGRELTFPEEEIVFYSDMATRIIFLLEDFDSNLETPLNDEEFFRKVSKLKKIDKKAKKLASSFLDIRNTLQNNTFGESPMTFGVNEIAWTRFLAGCSAVHSGRNFISADDIVMGNKVYIKLVNTDLDSLIRSL
ncbi:MAG: hypothetical protein CVV28_10855 [Methanobacteriales archaeon HGW-Methanobacteriales-1]|jgi:hypothetical protein|nr:MAG: hypothetical protein CVV28_10855 [Methanobacteriales archaeon HGW-Methanobacteriales-1]